MYTRFINVMLIIDNSGSMARYQKIVYNSTINLLDALANKNLTSEDVEYRVALAFFSNEVKKFAVVPMKPEMLKVVLDEKTFECHGGTNLSAAVNFIDSQFSHNSEFYTQKHAGDPKSFSLIISDMEGNVDEHERESALSSLKSNRFYSHGNSTLVVFTGGDDKKQDAAILAGGEENVIALNDRIADLLPFIAIESTLNMTDATHIRHGYNGELEEPTNADLAQKLLEREDEGADSGDYLARNSNDVDEELRKLLQEV